MSWALGPTKKKKTSIHEKKSIEAEVGQVEMSTRI